MEDLSREKRNFLISVDNIDKRYNIDKIYELSIKKDKYIRIKES